MPTMQVRMGTGSLLEQLSFARRSRESMTGAKSKEGRAIAWSPACLGKVEVLRKPRILELPWAWRQVVYVDILIEEPVDSSLCLEAEK